MERLSEGVAGVGGDNRAGILRRSESSDIFNIYEIRRSEDVELVELVELFPRVDNSPRRLT